MSDRDLPGIHPPSAKRAGGTRGCCLLIAAPAILLVVIVVVAMIWQGASGGTSSSGGAAEARYWCENEVKSNLKAPTTADFASDATGSGSNWSVTGSVDSENSFGAKIRSTYQCTVTLQSDGALVKIDYLR